MYIVLVKHEDDDRTFLFDCTELKNHIKNGSKLICDTVHGDHKGTAITDPIEVRAYKSDLATLLTQCGAYLPVKRILGIYQELTEAEIEMAGIEWTRKVLERPTFSENPFDNITIVR